MKVLFVLLFVSSCFSPIASGAEDFFSSDVVFDSQMKSLDLQFGVASVHSTSRQDGKPWNHSNTGLALQYNFSGRLFGYEVQYCATAGQVKNSEFSQTLFAGGCIRKVVFQDSDGSISFGLFGGVITYPSEYNSSRKPVDLIPAILPTMSACLRSGICLDTTYIPKVQKDQGSDALYFAGRFPVRSW